MRLLSAVLLTSLLLVTPATATSVYGTETPLVGSTTLLGFGNWAGNTSLAWAITPLSGGGGWLYNYTFTEIGSDLSHLVLQFSDNCAGDPGCISNATNNPDGPRLYPSFTPPNFEQPVSIYGVKFSFLGGSPYAFSFASNRAPVWGNMYARDGGNAYAYNAGLTNLGSSSTGDFVARPDGAAVPEPASLTLGGLGLGLLGLGLLKRKVVA